MAGLAAEWIKIPDGQGNLQKVWLRDSQARRDIAQLQTDVSGKAGAATTLAGYGITDAYTKTQVDGMIPSVPSAYTSNPAMDGTASPGSSTAWARGDHVHPHDSTKADVSAIPTKTSDLNNDSGFITSAPVTSVNGQTGAVSLTASDVGALPSSTAIPSKTSDLTNDSGFITASAVPNPSSAAPAMDGTAAAGSSTDYARADHVHPSDTNKQDALTTAQLDAVNSGVTADFVTKKFATVTGTFASSATYTALQSYPDGFTQTNCIVLALEAQRNGLWRGGGNTYGTSQQTFVQLEANGFTVFNSQSAGFNQPYRVTFMRTDI